MMSAAAQPVKPCALARVTIAHAPRRACTDGLDRPMEAPSGSGEARWAPAAARGFAVALRRSREAAIAPLHRRYVLALLPPACLDCVVPADGGAHRWLVLSAQNVALQAEELREALLSRRLEVGALLPVVPRSRLHQGG